MIRAFLLGILLLTTVVQAQPQKFGDIPREHLEMEVYDLDSTASAVVLFSYGESNLDYRNDRFYLSITRHERIKILTDEGLERGDIAIRYRNRGSDTPQRVTDIKASSYTINEQGKLVEEKVGRRDRFEEDISDTRSEIKFTIPGLKKGSVLEYSYEITSNNPLDFPDWLFQSDIPVMWSEYKARIPEWFKFLTVTRGFNEYYIDEKETYQDFITFRSNQNRMGSGVTVTYATNNSSRFDYEGTEYHYVMRDLPAIRQEPYMKASIDYLSHVRYQLAAIEMPNSMPKYYLTSWGDVVNQMAEDRDFGDRLKSSDELTQATANAIEGAEEDLDKMISLYNHVAETMDWNEELGLWAFESLEDAYEEGTANGTTINLILTQMLREAGLPAYPVVLSTRSHGEVIGLFPTRSQFNHTIVYVEIGERFYLLDAKNEERPYNLLPSQDLNEQGLLIYEDQEFWIPLKNFVANSVRGVMMVEMNDEGFQGQVKLSNKGLYAVNARNELDFDDLSGSVKEEVFSVDGAFTVDSAYVTNDKLDESFDLAANFSAKGMEGDIRYFNPMLMMDINENPFKLEKRTFPIDYDYPFMRNLIINVTVPQGWEVDEIPQSVLHRLPEQGGEFRRLAQQNGSIVTINFLFRINKTRFMPVEYEQVKEMYDQMVSMLSENIVLKRADG